MAASCGSRVSRRPIALVKPLPEAALALITLFLSLPAGDQQLVTALAERLSRAGAVSDSSASWPGHRRRES